jgi:hypothetical protein
MLLKGYKPALQPKGLAVSCLWFFRVSVGWFTRLLLGLGSQGDATRLVSSAYKSITSKARRALSLQNLEEPSNQKQIYTLRAGRSRLIY